MLARQKFLNNALVPDGALALFGIFAGNKRPHTQYLLLHLIQRETFLIKLGSTGIDVQIISHIFSRRTQHFTSLSPLSIYTGDLTYWKELPHFIKMYRIIKDAFLILLGNRFPVITQLNPHRWNLHLTQF